MWFFGSKDMYKQVVRMSPPLVGSFQQHAKVLKKYLPNVTKEELALACDRWKGSASITFLSPVPESKLIALAQAHSQEGWDVNYQGSATEARCSCDSFYNGTCCSGIPLGIHHEDVYELVLPETLFTKGSLMLQMSTGDPVDLTAEEVTALVDQGAALSSKRLHSLNF